MSVDDMLDAYPYSLGTGQPASPVMRKRTGPASEHFSRSKYSFVFKESKIPCKWKKCFFKCSLYVSNLLNNFMRQIYYILSNDALKYFFTVS